MTLTALIDNYLCSDRLLKQVYWVVLSSAILIAGFRTYYTSDDYYIDVEGEKQPIYFDNQFMFIEMKLWAYVFWVIGGFSIITNVYELIHHLLK
jgi:hypothetical protein